ncbi:MAG: glycogen/starch/alpha-glucan phosphorylase [Desulfurococcaceae archaeon]
MVIVSITPEIALEKSRTYAGGLGVLEGDKFYAAGDMGLDYTVLSLFYTHGYTKVNMKNNEMVFEEEVQDPEFYNNLKPDREIVITLKNSNVYVRPWIYTYKTAKAILFEATCPEWARKLTNRVYVEDNDEEKYLKYILLAKASAEYLVKNIGLENVHVIDLEESYTALILYILDIVDKARIILHTPGPWGHPVYPSEFLERELGASVPKGLINITSEAVKKLKEVIVVSRKQSDIIPRIFPEVKGKLRSITNGIYLERWMDPLLLNAWRKGEVNKAILEEARRKAKKELDALLRKYKPEVSVENKMVITWSRRLSKYKRPYFIARFIEENPDLDVIYVLAGKPHPKDVDGIRYLRWFRELNLKLRNVVYIPDYDLDVAKILVKSSDLWLFTPFSGWEACGTSYMKALVNGVPVLSSRDGGVLELVEDNVNGWLFGSDIRDFINIYEDPRAKEIDEKEYMEFKEKLFKIIDLYYSNGEKYWEISVNAWRNTPLKVDIRNVLKQYYLTSKNS